jgi:hypothetical protein
LPLRAAKVRGIGEKKKNKGKKWPGAVKITDSPGIGVIGVAAEAQRRRFGPLKG